MEDGEVRASIPRSSAEDDPELARPLESMADFERRQAEPAVRGGRGDGAATDSTAAAVTEGGTPPEVDGTPVPALADGDAVEPIGDAPIGDSELAAPLPPLGSFDVEPVQFAEPEDEGRNRTIQYSVQVNGLAAADTATDIDLGDLFGDLSALYDGDGKADNIAMVRARLRSEEHTSELQSLMRISSAVFCL